MNMNYIAELVVGEREYQDRMWPGHKHEICAFTSYMDHYLRVATDIDTKVDCHMSLHRPARECIRKICALAVAFLNQRGRSTVDIIEQATDENFWVSPLVLDGLEFSESLSYIRALLSEINTAELQSLGRRESTAPSATKYMTILILIRVCMFCMLKYNTPPREMPKRLTAAKQQS
jgi:hypothetical protein